MKTPLELFSMPDLTTGKLIKAFRKNFEISQEEMAWACDITQTNLSAIENDKREIGAKVGLKIAAFLGIDPSILLYPNGYKSEPEYKEVIKRRKKLA